MPRSFSRSAIAAGAALVALASCRQIVGIDDRSPELVVALDAAPADAAVSCQGCLTSSCSSELTACGASASCKQSLDCLGRCEPTDAACASKCVLGPLDPKLADALACRARSCTEPCALSCGGIAGVVRPKHDGANAACAKCMREGEVCAETNACAQDSNCIQAAACPWRCPLLDRACKTQCLYPLGPQPQNDKILMEKCRTECGMGKDWSCLPDTGKYSTATGKPRDVPINARIKYGVTPASDVSVRVCVAADCGGAPVLCVTKSDGYCSAQFPLTIPGPVFNNYFEAVGPDKLATLAFTHPPLSGAIAGGAAYCPFETSLLTKADFENYFKLSGLTADDTRGHIVASIFDCLGSNADGLVLASDPPSAKTLYLGASATDKSGLAALLNVPAGPTYVTITARRVSPEGKPLDPPVAQFQVLVRAGALTSVLLGPL